MRRGALAAVRTAQRDAPRAVDGELGARRPPRDNFRGLPQANIRFAACSDFGSLPSPVRPFGFRVSRAVGCMVETGPGGCGAAPEPPAFVRFGSGEIRICIWITRVLERADMTFKGVATLEGKRTLHSLPPLTPPGPPSSPQHPPQPQPWRPCTRGAHHPGKVVVPGSQARGLHDGEAGQASLPFQFLSTAFSLPTRSGSLIARHGDKGRRSEATAVAGSPGVLRRWTVETRTHGGQTAEAPLRSQH